MNYPAIMRAIPSAEYVGYVGQEVVPRNRESLAASLEQAYRVCDMWLVSVQ
jgi:hydroxypyruvate isomerase